MNKTLFGRKTQVNNKYSVEKCSRKWNFRLKYDKINKTIMESKKLGLFR